MDLARICADSAQIEAVPVLQKGKLMSDSKTYRDLDAWQTALNLSEGIYKLTHVLPDTERYGLISQMRRSSVSIPSNIAEGQARGTVAFGLYFLRVAIGSAAELDTQLELARRLRFVTTDATREVDRQLERVRQMLYGMRREHERRLATVGARVGSALLLLFAATRLFL
jgi:four helix bundle protein